VLHVTGYVYCTVLLCLRSWATRCTSTQPPQRVRGPARLPARILYSAEHSTEKSASLRVLVTMACYCACSVLRSWATRYTSIRHPPAHTRPSSSPCARTLTVSLDVPPRWPYPFTPDAACALGAPAQAVSIAGEPIHRGRWVLCHSFLFWTVSKLASWHAGAMLPHLISMY